MSIAIPPTGTRGVTTPRLPAPVMRLMTAAIFRVFHNRRFMGFPILRLTTIGARSGEVRHTILGYFTDPADPDAKIIVASAAGAARHPAWYFNLAKNPDQVWIEFNSSRLHVRPELLTGSEREVAWQHVVTEAPSYAGYVTKTDREIPIVRLRSIDAGANAVSTLESSAATSGTHSGDKAWC